MLTSPRCDGAHDLALRCERQLPTDLMIVANTTEHHLSQEAIDLALDLGQRNRSANEVSEASSRVNG